MNQDANNTSPTSTPVEISKKDETVMPPPIGVLAAMHIAAPDASEPIFDMADLAGPPAIDVIVSNAK